MDYEVFEVSEVKVPRHFPDFHVVSITNHFNIGTTKYAAVIYKKGQKSGFFFIGLDKNRPESILSTDVPYKCT
jgi:hypothetical protein